MKTIRGMKVEIKSIKKTQIKWELEMNNLGT